MRPRRRILLYMLMRRFREFDGFFFSFFVGRREIELDVPNEQVLAHQTT